LRKITRFAIFFVGSNNVLGFKFCLFEGYFNSWIILMIRTWRIRDNDNPVAVDFRDGSSLDAITRQLPDGYYSTFRTYDSCKRVVGLSVHLRRLPDVDVTLLRRQLILLLQPYRPGEARVRVILTFGGKLYISIEPLKRLKQEIYELGVRVETTSIQRMDPRTKSTAFIGQSGEERRNIGKRGVFEALLVKNGQILEGMTSNFFYVRDRILFTARRDILLGVTRRTVIRVARRNGFEVIYRPLELDQLAEVDEAFITSSSRGIVPVVQIDDVKVGEGRVGGVTRQLSAGYESYVIGKAEQI